MLSYIEKIKNWWQKLRFSTPRERLLTKIHMQTAIVLKERIKLEDLKIALESTEKMNGS